MGNVNSQASNSQRKTFQLQQEGWQFLYHQGSCHSLPYSQQNGQFVNIFNKQTLQKLQLYSLQFTQEEEYQQYMKCCQERKALSANGNLVRVHYCIGEVVKQHCSSTYKVELYTQFIPVRLSNIKDIPYPQNLYVLQATLAGFGAVFQNIGYVEPTERKVGITEQGIVQIWINHDFSKNYPSFSQTQEKFVDYQSYTMEKTFISQIFQLIAINTDHETEPEPLSVYISKNFITLNTFSKAQKVILEYACRYGAKIPTYFESIVDMLNEQGRLESNSYSCSSASRMTKKIQHGINIIPKKFYEHQQLNSYKEKKGQNYNNNVAHQNEQPSARSFLTATQSRETVRKPIVKCDNNLEPRFPFKKEQITNWQQNVNEAQKLSQITKTNFVPYSSHTHQNTMAPLVRRNLSLQTKTNKLPSLPFIESHNIISGEIDFSDRKKNHIKFTYQQITVPRNSLQKKQEKATDNRWKATLDEQCEDQKQLKNQTKYENQQDRQIENQQGLLSVQLIEEYSLDPMIAYDLAQQLQRGQAHVGPGDSR